MKTFWGDIQSITIMYVVTVAVVYKVAAYYDTKKGFPANFSPKEKFYVWVLLILVWGALILPVLKRYL
jgi:hypothetical protein